MISADGATKPYQFPARSSGDPACSAVGQLAQFYAENYRNMFSVTSMKER
jgi:hypothetical protein